MDVLFLFLPAVVVFANYMMADLRPEVTKMKPSRFRRSC